MKYNVTKNLAGAYSVKFNCPGCGVKLSEALKRAGQQDACPDCGQAFSIPGTKELAKYEAKQQQLAAEKAEQKAAKEAEKERARQEKEQQRAEAAEVARMIQVQEEKDRILAEQDAAHQQVLQAQNPPAPQKKSKSRHSGAALGFFGALAFVVAFYNFTLEASAETVMQQMVIAIRFYGALTCGCVLMVGSSLCYIIAEK